MMYTLGLRRLKAVLANCGGRNGKLDRSAGRLVESLTENDFIAICHCLIFSNGTRKTTARQRNLDIIKDKLERHLGRMPTSLSVLDVGASIGLDSMATIDWLQSRAVLKKYVLGDLYTHVDVDDAGGLVFDQDGNILQIRSDSYFTAINFSFQYWFQKYLNYFNYRRTEKLRRNFVEMAVPTAAIRIPLIHPDLLTSKYNGFVSLKRVNVFDSVSEHYDIIVCMNLLVARYFNAAQVASGVANLSNALAVGGILIAGANDGGVVLQRSREDGVVRKLSEW